jgi:hypothetical protein
MSERQPWIVLDTDQVQKCLWCSGMIQPDEPKVVYGVGSTLYVRVFHVRCYNEHFALKNEDNDQTNRSGGTEGEISRP